jgi:expansin
MRRLTLYATIASSFAWVHPGWAVLCDTTVHQGPATYYDFADGSGVCGYPAATGNQMVVALDAPELAATALCGACIHIQGPDGEVTVLVVNGCPGCEVGHLDLSPQAYDRIAADYNGVPPITWQYVPCDVTGPIRYAYYSGSSTNFAWVQVRNHRHPIAIFEARMADGSYAQLERADWGYFKAMNLPAGGQTYRVTDIYGQVLEDQGIAVPDQGEVEGKGQFPACTGSAQGGGGPFGATGAGGTAYSTAASAQGGSPSASTAVSEVAGSGTTGASNPEESGCACRAVSAERRGGETALFLIALVAALGLVRERR